MVHRPLPPALIKRLRKAAETRALERHLGSMKKADPRKDEFNLNPRNTSTWPGRVRSMKIQRNFPGIELLIKRVHDTSARRTIEILKSDVDRCNKDFPDKGFILRKPIAYALSDQLVAMAKCNFPTLSECRAGSEKSKEFLKKHEIAPYLIEGIIHEVEHISLFHPTHLFVVGFEGNQPILVPLIDLY